MHFSKTTIVGVSALIVGLLFGYLIRGGDDAEEALLRQTEALSGKVDSIGAEVAGLGEKLGTMEGSVAELQSAQDSRLADLGSRLEGIGKSVSDTTQSLGQSLGGEVQSQLEAFRGQISALVGRGGGGGGEGGGAAPGAGGGGAASGTPLTPGVAASLADGKLRVFLSAADPEAGTARVAVNGPGNVVALTAGEAVEVDGCRVTLTGFDDTGAALVDGGC